MAMTEKDPSEMVTILILSQAEQMFSKKQKFCAKDTELSSDAQARNVPPEGASCYFYWGAVFWSVPSYLIHGKIRNCTAFPPCRKG